MPFTTKNYKLTAFKRGDPYSSYLDQRRFSIIDNEMAFLADKIGSGLIDGWDITNNGDGTLTISSGMGIINRRVVSRSLLSAIISEITIIGKTYRHFFRACLS